MTTLAAIGMVCCFLALGAIAFELGKDHNYTY
jgi:hypothetical protein